MVAAEPFGDVHAHGNDLVGIGGGELFDFHAAFGAADKHDFGFHRVHGDGEVDFAVDVHGLFNEEHTDVVFGFEQGLGGGLGAFRVLHDLDKPSLAAPAAQHLRLEYARKSYLRKCAVQFVHAAYQYALRGRQAFFAEGFLRLIFKQLHGSSFWKRMPPAARGLGPLDSRRGAWCSPGPCVAAALLLAEGAGF